MLKLLKWIVLTVNITDIRIIHLQVIIDSTRIYLIDCITKLFLPQVNFKFTASHFYHIYAGCIQLSQNFRMYFLLLLIIKKMSLKSDYKLCDLSMKYNI